MLILNLFGTGIRYWICEIPEKLFEEMEAYRQKEKVEWEYLLFDLHVLKKFGLKHWSELAVQPERTGFLLHPQNRIEVKQGAKFIARFRASELHNQDTIFPLYQTEKVPFTIDHSPTARSLVLIQFEKGLIAKYRIETPKFLIDELLFELSSTGNDGFISAIRYKGELLVDPQEDSLVVGTSVSWGFNT